MHSSLARVPYCYTCSVDAGCCEDYDVRVGPLNQLLSGIGFPLTMGLEVLLEVLCGKHSSQ